MHSIIQLLQAHQVALGIGLLWIFSGFVSAMPPATDKSGPVYSTVYRFLHFIAGNLGTVFGKYLPPSAKTGATALMAIIGLGLLATSARAQTAPAPAPPAGIQNLYAAGVSYGPGASPAIAGTGLYARNLNTGATLPTYAFTVVDALPGTMKPFTVTTNMGAGIAQQVAILGTVPIYVPTSVGISWSGQNTGWEWTTGALASIHPKATSNIRILVGVRLLKSSVSGGSGYQPIVSALASWGK